MTMLNRLSHHQEESRLSGGFELVDLPFSACAGKGCFREISQIKLRTWPNNDDQSLHNELREQFYTKILDRQLKYRGT